MKTIAAIIGSVSLLAALAMAATPSDAAPTTNAGTWSMATIPLANDAAAYDATRDRLLVGVNKSVPTIGNNLIEIDPSTGAIGRTIFVGGGPKTIAVADDGSRAYVGLIGGPIVVEVDLATFAVTRRINLGYGAGPYFATDIEIQPGNPEVIAVSRVYWPTSGAGVVVYEAGVRRADAAGPAERIEWSDDPGTVYGYQNGSSSFAFSRMAVDADGIRVIDTKQLITGFGVDIEYVDGLIHATSGQVVDPDAMALVGSYDTVGTFAYDEAQDKAFFASSGQVRRYDGTTLLNDWTATFQLGALRQLIDAGAWLVARSNEDLRLLGPGASAAGYTSPPAPESLVQGWGAVSQDLDAAALVANAAGDTIYAVVDDTALTYPSAVVEFDVKTGSIGRSVFVGADPSVIEITPDGTRLMVGHKDAAKVTEIDVASFTIARSVTVPTSVLDIAASPDASGRYAVALSTVYGPARIIDNGVVLPDRSPGNMSAITFAGDPTRLYGYDALSTRHYFYEMEVHATGITTLRSFQKFLLGVRVKLTSSDGLIYVGDGSVVDPLIPTALGKVGASGVPLPLPDVGRLLMFGGSTIFEFDLDEYWAVSEQPLPSGSAVAAVSAGDTAVVATDDAKILFIPIGPDTRTPPGAPTAVAGIASNATVDVAWDPPVDNGGAPVTGYTATADPGGATCTTTASTGCDVAGLTNGVAYTFTVTATNIKGTSAASAPSDPVTPTGPPGPPLAVGVTVGDTTATVSWTAPIDDGGRPVTGYTTTATPGGATCTTADTGCDITGLTNGLPYTFAVTATNDAGTGPASAPTGPATPTSCGGLGAGPFPDVATGHTFCTQIEWMVALALAGGYADGGFHPTAITTRQAIAAFFYRYAGSPTFALPPFPTFTDINPDHQFYREIEWLAAAGLANGYADGSFGATQPVTRQSAAALFYRYADSPAFTPPAIPTFTDVAATHPFYLEIEWLAATGITTGYPDGTFGPTRQLTRQAIAAYYHRYNNL